MTPPPHSLQPFQASRGDYAPPTRAVPFPTSPEAPPTRPAVPLGRTLAWTGVISTLGVALMVLVVGLVVLMVLALVYVLVAMLGIDPAELWDGGSLRDSTDNPAGTVALVVLLAAVVSFALSAGALLLLRRSDSVRRWASFLQAVAACGTVYLGGGVLLGIAFLFGG